MTDNSAIVLNRPTAHSANTHPPQKQTQEKKTERWQKAHLSKIEKKTIGKERKVFYPFVVPLPSQYVSS